MKTVKFLLILIGALSYSPFATASIGEAEFRVNSLLGASGDSVRGARILSDGTIVLAANVSGGELHKQSDARAGLLIHLAPGDGKVITTRKISSEVRDLAIDADNNLYLALGKEGAVKLSATGTGVIWKKATTGVCSRIDAAPDGTCAVLSYSRDEDSATGAGEILVLAKDGSELGNFKGRHNTLDVAIDQESKTIISIGWRQANCWDGKKKQPVQIAHLTGRAFDGVEKYQQPFVRNKHPSNS